MAFSKLDSDAVSSTLSRPLDAFVAQGVDANVRAAWTARGRGASKAFGSDKRPVLASAGLSCVPLGPWPVSPGCTEITCKLRGLATSDGAGGVAIKARLMLQTLSGAIYDNLGFTNLNDSASAQEVELTADTSAVEGEVVVVWLVFQSALVTTSTASDDLLSTAISNFNYKINLGSTIGATFDDAKRWQLTFGEDAAGIAPAESISYPGPVMIVNDAGSNVVSVLPRIDSRLNSYSTFRATITELGRFELYGWSLTETTITEPAALTDALRPASVPRARTFSELYRRQRALHVERTRVVSVGGSEDYEADGRKWGRAEQYDEATNKDAYLALGGELPTYRIDTRTATLQYRLRYRALALVAGVTIDQVVRGFQAVAEVTITDLGGGATQNPTVNGDTVDVSPLQAVLPGVTNRSGDRLWMTFSDGHHLDGAWVYDDVVAGRHGLHLLDLTFEEASPAASTSARLIQIEIATAGIEPAIGSGTLDTSTRVYYPACTVMIDEGF